MAKNVAEQLVQQLVEAGVNRIYGVVGDSLNPIVDAVRRTGGAAKGGIDWVHVRHEEVGAFAAAAEAQVTGRLAVCAGSCGPGNTHLVNGLYDAHRSGAPVLALASHIPSSQIGQGYFQETHPDRVFTDCSDYCELVSTAEQAPRVVHAAIRHAVQNRSVSVVSLPGDIADLDVAAEAPRYVPVRRGVTVPTVDAVRELADELNRAEKVALFCGEGVRGAHAEVMQLADTLAAPVGHSLRGKDAIQFDNPFDVGMTGLLGYGAAAAGIEDADLLVMLGTDFPYDQFLPGTRTVQVDTDAAVIGRRTDVDLPIQGDVRSVIEAVLPLLKRKDDRRFLERMLEKHERLMTKSVGAYTHDVLDMKPVHPEYAADLLDQLMDDDAVVTADTGMCNVWSARYVRPLGTRRLIASFLHGSMANALPHAIGAQLADRERQVVAMCGDGGLSMLLGDLLTPVTYDLPMTAVVFNNSTLGMVKLEMLVDELPSFGTDVPATDYAAIAGAMGWRTWRVEDPRDLEAAYREALAHRGPSLVDVVTDPNALSLPPKITSDQVFGFATAMSKIVLNGGVGEVVSMARSNMRNIPRR
ncbi:pyruvate dehydrogenase [Kytococcus schroeteri]|uniref:pyruvate dehydrogenase n=1 Tax=Kytococcus schroeteri TaxID=138300 RepID=UPI00114264FE|nr:pyruvate dehydrogenase [Kytococcus schroeteri]